jgi:tetratricopeptide (TPR) repeat protein
MAKNIKEHNAKESVEQAINTTEHFVERYKNYIIYGVIAVVAIVAIGLAYQNFYRKPKIKEALAQIFTAEQDFRVDSFAKALNGDGNSFGFKKIIDEYGSAAGEAVYFYAGTCELQLGNYENAINYFKKYESKDKIMMARALCCIGDCYANMKKYQDAVDYYVDAAKYNDNELAASYYLKAGLIYEEMGKKDKALEVYQIIKDRYQKSVEGYEIDKYISRIQQ